MFLNSLSKIFKLTPKVSSKTLGFSPYDYLLKLPIYTLSEEEIDKLLKEKELLLTQHTLLSNQTTKDMWLEELELYWKKAKKL